MRIIMFDFMRKKERTEYIDGYKVGIDTGTIYHCPKDNKEYRLPKRAKVLSREACNEISQGEKLIIPNSFKTFTKIYGVADYGTSPFNNDYCKLKEVYFEDGITDIEIRFFNLSKVAFNIPNSVEHLRPQAVDTDSEGRLIIGSNVTEMDSSFAAGDLSVKSVEIYGSLKEIPTYAFNQCRNLETVIIHEGVEKAGKHVFRGTNKLNYLKLPESFNGDLGFDWENRSSSPKKKPRIGKKGEYEITEYQYKPTDDELYQQQTNLTRIVIKRKRKRV